MHQLVKAAKTDWFWIQLCSSFIQGAPSKDYYAECERLFNTWHRLIWKRGYLRYQQDPNQVELIEGVWKLLERRASDCDGYSILIAASVGAIGHTYRFVTVNGNPADPTDPTHVYTQVGITNGRSVQWQGADLTVREASFGWEPKGYPTNYWPEPNY